MIPARTIERKREGASLEPGELRSFLEGFLAGAVSEAQMSAFLMAVTFRGLDAGELDVLVDTMVGSGSTMKRRHRRRPRVDKHSTGGVGDKVSLVLAPLAAELGIDVPMMSGRGLGHTGGTLDKLESIPGFTTSLDLAAFEDVVQAVGTAMIGQTAEIAPLDRRLYALRSATGTVPCIPLIASSIMSKKLSEDLDGLVLDVKVGKGSFLRERHKTEELARTMVEIGRSRGVPTVALLTRMDWPIGRAVGNALEVVEAVRCLHGEGPADLAELTCQLVGEMLLLAGLETDRARALERTRHTLSSGAAAPRFRLLVERQGGDPSVVDNPELFARAPVRLPVAAKEGGRVEGIDPLALGWGVVELGGGRRGTEETIVPSVGFELGATVGDSIEVGGALGWVHAQNEADAERGSAILSGAFAMGEVYATPPTVEPLVYSRIGP